MTVHVVKGGISFNGSQVAELMCPFSSFFGTQNINITTDVQVISGEDWRLASQGFMNWDPKSEDDYILNDFLINKYSTSVALEVYTITRDAEDETYSKKRDSYLTENAVYLSRQFPNGFIITSYPEECSKSGWATSFWGDAVSKGILPEWLLGITCESELLSHYILNGQLFFPNSSVILDSSPYREFFDAVGTQLMSRYLISILFFTVSFVSLQIAYYRKKKVHNTSSLIMAILLVNGYQSIVLGVVTLLDGARMTGFLPHRFTWAFMPAMFITTVGTDFMLSSLWSQLRTRNKSHSGLIVGLGFVLFDIVSMTSFFLMNDFFLLGYGFSILAFVIQVWIIATVSHSTLKFLYDFRHQMVYAKSDVEYKMNELFHRVAKALLLTMLAELIRLAALLAYIAGVVYLGPLWDRIIVCSILYGKIATMFAQCMVCQVPVSTTHSTSKILPNTH